mmetsp:Transcript_110391/g.219407  ORF Transcript_110391/g.219407 Transcript_110391/m.219407 type:complete len:221 (+) Transcript_110391:521-1183(+)
MWFGLAIISCCLSVLVTLLIFALFFVLFVFLPVPLLLLRCAFLLAPCLLIIFGSSLVFCFLGQLFSVAVHMLAAPSLWLVWLGVIAVTRLLMLLWSFFANPFLHHSILAGRIILHMFSSFFFVLSRILGFAFVLIFSFIFYSGVASVFFPFPFLALVPALVFILAFAVHPLLLFLLLSRFELVLCLCSPGIFSFTLPYFRLFGFPCFLLFHPVFALAFML